MKYQEKYFEGNIRLDHLLTLMSLFFSRLKYTCSRTIARQVLKTGILSLQQFHY